jgi:phenylacetic acid degradation protein paaN
MFETLISGPAQLFEKHRDMVERAIEAIYSREFYAQYPESPSGKIYGETAAETQMGTFNSQLGAPFTRLKQDFEGWLLAREKSPYTLKELEISYPVLHDVNSIILRAGNALSSWKKTSLEERTGILAESLEQVKSMFYEIAYSTQHTTGQSFVMSFQASGPHANDRALEALALGYEEQKRFPTEVHWEKPMGKFNVVLSKFYKAVPKGISLSIGCSTFPIWNSLPGIYASLVTGNPVIVKPHPTAIYPIALVVSVIQEILVNHNLDPHIIQLACDTPEEPVTMQLCEHPAVKLIDFTGGNSFGNYVESLPGKTTFTEKAGVNSVIIDSCKDLDGMMQNLAFSVSLYSGQMCTCPQNIYIPKTGITANGEHISFEKTAEAFVHAVQALASNEKMGPGTLGAIQSENTAARVRDIANKGVKVLLNSTTVNNPEFPDARTASPLVLEVPVDRKDLIEGEYFGPIVFIIPTDSTDHSIALAKTVAIEHGALTCSAYTTHTEIMEKITSEMSEAYTPVSFNLTGPIWVNQSAGFSDFHVSGGNPAGNASFTNPEFVLKRFVWVGIRQNKA